MSNFVSSLVRSNNNITELQYSVDTGGTAYSVFKTFKESVSPKEVITKINVKYLNGDGFILGNNSYGILGTSLLGADSGSVIEERILPPNDIFTERFISNNMIDTLTNCNITNNILTFTGTGLISSEIVYYNNINIIQAKVDIVINTDENITIYLSNDDGSTWEQVTNGGIHIFTSTGKKLKYKITADNGTIIERVIVTKL